MTYSKPLLGTNKKTLSWIEYILQSCIQQGWYNCWYSFKNWGDLMGNSYQGYGILKEDDDLEWCIDYFWTSLEDEIYPKHFLEELMQMVEDVKTGKEKTYTLDEVTKELKTNDDVYLTHEEMLEIGAQREAENKKENDENDMEK
jgi:hypothetical protein